MRTVLKFLLAAFCLGAAVTQAQSLTPPLPPIPQALPSDLPPAVSTPPPRARQAPAIPARKFKVVRPQPQRAQRPFPRPRYTPPAQLPDSVLAWDETAKEYTARPGDLAAPFSFALTNVSDAEVTINWVRPSCGCTVAKLPPTPWKIAPNESGLIELSVDLKGKHGTLSKYVVVNTSRGQKILNIKVHIPERAITRGMDARMRNLRLAAADRQIVFRGQCASCHATPAIGKMGGELFAAACAICHEAPERATMVPDLRALKVDPTFDYWKHWITNGKPGSLMPAFAKDQGGPLTPEQIDSLAEFLTENYPQRDAVPAATAASASAGGHDHAHGGDHDHDHGHAVPASK